MTTTSRPMLDDQNDPAGFNTELILDPDGEEVYVVVDEWGTIQSDNPHLWLPKIARAHAEANDQIKRWKHREEGYELTLLRYYPQEAIDAGKPVQLGPTRVTRVQSHTQKTDVPAFLGELSEAELTTHDWRALALAATGFKESRLPVTVHDIWEKHTKDWENEPYIRTTVTARRLK